MYTSLLSSLQKSEAEKLIECGLTQEAFEACTEEEKIILLVHYIIYTKISNRIVDFDVKQNAKEDFQITEAFINKILNDKDVQKMDLGSFDDIFISINSNLLQYSQKACANFLKNRKIVPSKLMENQYEHPLDSKYLDILKSTKGVDFIGKKITEYGMEPIFRIDFTGSNLKVSYKNMPDLYSIFEEACEILDIKDVPELYIRQGFINGVSVGDVRPIVVIDSMGASCLTRNELLFLFGHELGHIKSHHPRYHMMADALPIISQLAGSVTLGLSNILSLGLSVAIANWKRMAELTADRAGLLCCQDINSAISIFMKLSGLPMRYYSNIDSRIDSFIEQARQFEDFDESNMNKVIKYASILGEDHPWLVMRGKELLTWYENGEYDAVISGKMAVPATNNISGYVYCENCGVQCMDDDSFCSNCGNKLKR